MITIEGAGPCCFPGEEDFGIVPIEALACGAPVIALGAAAWPRPSTTPSAGPMPEPTVDCAARRDRRLGIAGLPAQSDRGTAASRGACHIPSFATAFSSSLPKS